MTFESDKINSASLLKGAKNILSRIDYFLKTILTIEHLCPYSYYHYYIILLLRQAVKSHWFFITFFTRHS